MLMGGTAWDRVVLSSVGRWCVVVSGCGWWCVVVSCDEW